MSLHILVNRRTTTEEQIFMRALRDIGRLGAIMKIDAPWHYTQISSIILFIIIMGIVVALLSMHREAHSTFCPCNKNAFLTRLNSWYIQIECEWEKKTSHEIFSRRRRRSRELRKKQTRERNQQGTIYFTKTTHRNLHICNLYIVDFPFENKFMYVHSARL